MCLRWDTIFVLLHQFIDGIRFRTVVFPIFLVMSNDFCRVSNVCHYRLHGFIYWSKRRAWSTRRDPMLWFVLCHTKSLFFTLSFYLLVFKCLFRFAGGELIFGLVKNTYYYTHLDLCSNCWVTALNSTEILFRCLDIVWTVGPHNPETDM